jgi:16S rRNA (guanine527-N7)-methyltransferase
LSDFVSERPADPPPAAEVVFGDRLALAVRYAQLLAERGVARGVIGPGEPGRLWERHLLNSAVVAEVIAPGSRVVDLGSGAGLPGVPLALARPDLDMTLLEPMARRVDWLREVVASLGLPVRVVRGRAEEPGVIRSLGGCAVVVARAVAPLGRLCGWALPLLAEGGLLVAMKGSAADNEVARDSAAVRQIGGRAVRVHDCGAGIVDPLTRVVLVERAAGRRARHPVHAVRRKRRRG